MPSEIKDAPKKSNRGGARPGAGRKPGSVNGALRIEHVPPATLKPAPYNPRKMEDAERKRLERGIKEFGLVDPIIARRSDGLVIGGHQRLASAIALGMERVPVVYLDGITDDRAAALNILLNNPAVQGEFDMPKLTDILSELDAHGFDATLTGFDDDDLATILSADPGEADVGQLGDVDYQVVVSCPGEHAQSTLCEELEARGLKCRLLTL